MCCTCTTYGQVRIWPYERANGDHTIDVLRRLRAEIPTGKLIVFWDSAPYHRAKTVWAAAGSLGIHLLPLPSYSPDLMAVEPLWRWLREDVIPTAPSDDRFLCGNSQEPRASCPSEKG